MCYFGKNLKIFYLKKLKKRNQNLTLFTVHVYTTFVYTRCAFILIVNLTIYRSWVISTQSRNEMISLNIFLRDSVVSSITRVRLSSWYDLFHHGLFFSFFIMLLNSFFLCFSFILYKVCYFLFGLLWILLLCECFFCCCWVIVATLESYSFYSLHIQNNILSYP